MAARSPIKIQGIHHVSINVNDIEAALEFYVNILELEQLPRPDLRFPGAWLKAGAQEIHLLSISSADPLKEQHFALAVSDADSIHAALSGAGFTPSPIREIPNICRQFFSHDPSGNMIEFNQRLEPYPFDEKPHAASNLNDR